MDSNTYTLPIIIERYQKVNKVLQDLASSKAATLEGLVILGDFASDYKFTNNISMALIDENVDEFGPSEQLITLHQLASENIKLYLAHQDHYDSLDINSVVELVFKPLEEEKEALMATTNKYWLEYQALGRRMDYLPSDDPEYIALEEKAEQFKKLHDEEAGKIPAVVEKLTAVNMKYQDARRFNFTTLYMISIRVEEMTNVLIGGKEEA